MTWRGVQPPFVPLADSGGTPQTTTGGLPPVQPAYRHTLAPPPPGTLYGVPGQPVSQASGNPAVSTNPVVDPPKNPIGWPRVLGVAQETAWRGGWQFANDKLVTTDRHILSKVGSEISGRDSGNTDPPSQGPARPSYQTINRTINFQSGSDASRNQDDLSRAYATDNQGRWLGDQSGVWTEINGGMPGLWQPYGSYAGITNGPVQGIQSPVPYGEPGDGRKMVFSGPPHGLHSPTLPSYSQTLGYYMAVPQMRLPRIDRPDNSTIAGQSYSQTVVPQGQVGTVAQQSGSGVNFRGRTANAGWRGR